MLPLLLLLLLAEREGNVVGEANQECESGARCSDVFNEQMLDPLPHKQLGLPLSPNNQRSAGVIPAVLAPPRAENPSPMGRATRGPAVP
jgi:hypothetical protein